jgi:glutamate 5-kinase
MTDHLDRSKRIVVKVGSALLVDAASGAVKSDWLASLAADLAALRKAGKDVIVVSSGAIALGRRALKLKAGGALRLEESQAAAAAGQIRLAQSVCGRIPCARSAVAQVLLTLEDTEQRRRYLNARETLTTLLALNAIPVINENDTVATAEIRYGDNDRLGARVASMMEADCLVFLSDIDGLYTANPQRDANARHIPEVKAITARSSAWQKGRSQASARAAWNRRSRLPRSRPRQVRA